MKNFRHTDLVFRNLELLAQIVFAPLRPFLNVKGLQETVNYTTLIDAEKNNQDSNSANQEISRLIKSGEPALVSRFGSTELRALVKLLHQSRRTPLQKIYSMIARLEAPTWSAWEFRNLSSQSGFFPITKNSTEQFLRMYLSAIPDIDVLGSWVPGENQLHEYIQAPVICPLDALEPFFAEQPWTRSLESKKVLVVHPFKNSIQRQYAKRIDLWEERGLLPEFSLQVLSPPQTLASNTAGYGNWFEALDETIRDIEDLDFDVALIAAGAYGMPLGSAIKRMGKVAIHLGGVLQVLFGIKGRRWAQDPRYVQFFNKSWQRPSSDEIPAGYKRVDGGVYW